MPFESPEMLERDLARGQVEEDTVDSPGVAVNTEVLHLMTKAGPLPVFGRRRDAIAGSTAAHIEWSAAAPHTVQKQRDLSAAVYIHASPVVSVRTALERSVTRRSVEYPIVHAVTGHVILSVGVERTR